MADKKTIKELIDLHQQLNRTYDDELNSINKLFNTSKERAVEQEKYINNQRLINDLKNNSVNLDKKDRELLVKLEKEQRNLISSSEKYNKNLKTRTTILSNINNLFKTSLDYLMKSDSIIKSTNLNLGLSGVKADMMRNSFEKSAAHVARLGGSITDIQSIMQGYADETGRARAMSSQMVEDITNIGKGTGLGIVEATKLGGRFELMGVDARRTMNYVQGVVDTSERMGVNTTKVLKTVNDNFKRLSTYTFRKGVQGFADMATFAEKFKVDINQALNTVDIAKTLEGSINLAAQLQVMGGEFAKSNPYEMMFLSRNDPDKMIEKIAHMTKGLVTFRKNSEGIFEKFISPADRDRIAAVAKSMGMEASALTEMAYRHKDLEKMGQELRGIGLSDKQQKLIEGAAIFNSETGKFQVQLGDHMKNIGDLTREQANTFETEQVLLKERAKNAMSFDKVFQATIEELKSTLLPILKTFNKGVTWLGSLKSDWLRIGLTLTAGAVLWKGLIPKMLSGFKSLLSSKGSVMSRVGGGMTDMVYNKGGEVNQGASKARFLGQSNLAKAQGTKNLKSGAGAGLAAAGFGAAMAGAGAGVMLAAKGISQLADAMSKLTPDQAENLASIVKSLSWFMAGAAIAAVGIMALGTVAGATAAPLLAFGAAILMIGSGIGVAAAGIGYMTTGFSTLFEKTKGGAEEMGKIALSMTKMAGALALFTVGGLGLPVFLAAMGAITIASHSSAKMASNLEKMGTAMKGSKDDWIAVQNAVTSISNANTKGGGMIADLANLLKKPLQVEFKDKNLAVVSNITMEVDGKKIFNDSFSVNGFIQKVQNVFNQKGDNN